MTLTELRALDPGHVTPAEIDFLAWTATLDHRLLRLEQLDRLTPAEAALIKRTA